MTAACPDDGELAQFVERELPEERRAEIETHLGSCEACSDSLGYLVEAFAERESVPAVDADRSALPGKGDTLGRYVILDWIGAGAMGAVYAAFDPELDRKVALKLLPPRRGEEGERLRARFLSEARAMASVSHPNVIAVHDVGQHDDLAFFAMELVDGQTLGQWCHAATRSVSEIVEVFVAAGRGLAAAHASGLVHRDFKPANALIGYDGRVRVIDFGLARFAAESVDTRPPEEEPIPVASPDTRTGTLLGTPAYMAPEQLAGKPSDALADQFAFCVSLYEALHGNRPFMGTSLPDLVEAIERGSPADAKVSVPRRVRRALARGLSARPDDRYPSMDTLVAALTSRPLSRWGPTVIVALATGGLAFAINTAVTGDAGIACDRDADRLAGVWDPSRRAALIDALAPARSQPSARTTAHWLADRIDEYADEWSTTRYGVCVSTLERHEQSFAMMDRQMICLERAKAQLGANVELLIERGASEPDTIPTFVDGLPAIASCRDLDTLQAGPPAPPPLVADEVEAQRRALAQARALFLAGDFRGSLAIAENVAAAAETIDYAPLRYEARLARAAASYRLADLPVAQRELDRVLDETLAVGDRVTAARAAATLSCMAATELGKPEAGLAYAKTALGLTRAMKGSAGVRAHALRCSARALKHAGRFEEAEKRLREAIEVLEDDGEVHTFEQGRVRTELGQALIRRRKFAEAEKELRRARELVSAAFGPDNAMTAEASGELAAALVEQGDFATAHKEYQRVIDVWTRAAGPRVPAIGIVHGKIGNLYYSQDRYDDAESEFRLAREIVTEAYGPEHPTVIAIDASLANIYDRQGKHREAADAYLDVLARFESGASPLHPMAVQLRISAANSLMQILRFDEALQTLEPAVPACTEGTDVPRDLCGDLELVRARCKLELHDTDAAARHLAAMRTYYADTELTPDTREVIDELKRDLADASAG